MVSSTHSRHKVIGGQSTSRRTHPLGKIRQGRYAHSKCRPAGYEVRMPRSKGSVATATPRKVRKEEPTVLVERSAPQEVVRVLLNDSKLTLGELSEMIGAKERSISRWARSGKSIVIQERYLNAIDD